MKIQSRPQLDAAQEAQLTFIKLLKCLHNRAKGTDYQGIVQLSFRATHSEIETVAIFDDGSKFEKTEPLHELSYIPQDL